MVVVLNIRTCLMLAIAWHVILSTGLAQDPQQSQYYRISKVPTPENVVLEVGAFEFMPDGRLAASSRRGDIYMFDQPLQADASKITSKLFASGLHEVLGLIAIVRLTRPNVAK